MDNWCWCCVVPPASAGEVIVPINADEVKRSLIARGNAVVSLKNGEGFGILISKDLILTTHSTVPDLEAARGGCVSVHVSALLVREQKLLPERFFITNREMDLTLVACEPVTMDVLPLMIDSARVSRQSLEVGNKVYILGHPKGSNSPSAALGEGKVSLKDDKYLRIHTDGLIWSAGSAGFNEKGQFAFVVSNPRPLQSAGADCSSSAEDHSGVSIKDVCSRMLHSAPGC